MIKPVQAAAALLCLAGMAAPLGAHEVVTTKLTWTREISRIFEKRCMGCHQPGGRAPFALTNWKEARPWAVAIRDEIAARRMPPWNAVKGFGDFRNDMALSQQEIQLIIDWANGGAPEGDKRLATGVLPKPWSPQDLPAARPLRVSGSMLLATLARIDGIRAAALAEGGSAMVVLERPDGSVEPLVWVKGYREAWRQTLIFRRPVMAPAGSRVKVFAPGPAEFELLLAPPARRRPAAGAPAAVPDPAQAGA